MGKVLEITLNREIKQVEQSIKECKENLSLLKNTTSEYYQDVVSWLGIRELYLNTLLQLKNLEK